MSLLDAIFNKPLHLQPVTKSTQLKDGKWALVATEYNKCTKTNSVLHYKCGHIFPAPTYPKLQCPTCGADIDKVVTTIETIYVKTSPKKGEQVCAEK